MHGGANTRWLIQVDYRFTRWKCSHGADVNDVLAANRAAVLHLVAAAERSAATWTTPRATGKWSPSQVVEHVAGGLEEAANGRISEGVSNPIARGTLR
jgi:hypothetical protein